MARKKARRATSDLRELRGGRLSYGQPVCVDGRTVIPVTRVRLQRFGATGGGGSVESAPVGYIEITSGGSAFHPIEHDGVDPARALRAAAAAATTIVGAIAGARALRGSRRSPRLLPPGRSRR